MEMWLAEMVCRILEWGRTTNVWQMTGFLLEQCIRWSWGGLYWNLPGKLGISLRPDSYGMWSCILFLTLVFAAALYFMIRNSNRRASQILEIFMACNALFWIFHWFSAGFF